jgi:hypothetical protein
LDLFLANLSCGRFGTKITMENTPLFDNRTSFTVSASD